MADSDGPPGLCVRPIPTMNHSTKRSHEEIIIALSCAAGVVCVAPFVVIRLLFGEVLVAVIDAVVVSGIALLGLYMWFSRRIAVARVALNIFFMVGVTVLVYLKGMALIYWVFPATTVSFFLVGGRWALVLNGVTLCGLLPVIYSHTGLVEFIVFLWAVILTNMFGYIYASRTDRQHRLLTRQARRDHLTGAGNRLALHDQLSSAVAEYVRGGTAVSLILLDLDHFKIINDNHGHAAGDRILVIVSQILRCNLRLSDGLFRFGGEEFVVVAMGAPLAEAVKLAEKLRAEISGSERLAGHGVTLSAGVAQLIAGESAQSWLQRADEALYRAKRDGRNTTRIAGQP